MSTTPEQPIGSNPEAVNAEVQQRIAATRQGFSPATVALSAPTVSPAITSPLSVEPAIELAQMVELEGGDGSIIYYPPRVPDLDVGDVLYLREKQIDPPATIDEGENGIIVQVIEKGTVSYPQASSKSLFRLMASVRADELKRSHHEPPETIDQFLALQFKVRSAIVNAQWTPPEGRVVTRNVDIFKVSPGLLVSNIIVSV
jgi:hypothetical protein